MNHAPTVTSVRGFVSHRFFRCRFQSGKPHDDENLRLHLLATVGDGTSGACPEMLRDYIEDLRNPACGRPKHVNLDQEDSFRITDACLRRSAGIAVISS